MLVSAIGGRRLTVCIHHSVLCFQLLIKRYIISTITNGRKTPPLKIYTYATHRFIHLLLQKKLSFPATVSHAVKYIPQLQEQVERLVQKKEELLLRISQQGGIKCFTDEEELRKRNGKCSSSVAVSINRLSSDSEVAIQISMNKGKVLKSQLSEILDLLEQEGFLLLNATSLESFGGMVFYNIHLQAESEATYQLTESDIEALSEKLLALCDNREGLLLYN